MQRVNSQPAQAFANAVTRVACGEPRYGLAELNSLLCGFTARELQDAVGEGVPAALSPYLANYIAAMVELACVRRRVALPGWLSGVPPLTQPVFGSDLKSLRAHLLSNSPAPFQRRNIFIDATLGDRV
jgi:hypothetical protein